MKKSHVWYFAQSFGEAVEYLLAVVGANWSVRRRFELSRVRRVRRVSKRSS